MTSFANLLMSELRQLKSASAFSLLQCVVLIGICGKNLASQRNVVGQRRSILLAFLDNWQHSSLVLYQN